MKLFCLLYGEEHREERSNALKHLRKFHDEKPELPTVHFIVEAWDRMWFGYSEAVRGGIRSLLRILPDGSNKEALVSLALSPYGKTGKRVWRWPDVFSFRSRRGMRIGRLLPELGEKLELSRITGAGFNHTGGSGGLNTVSNVVVETNIKGNGKNNRKGKGNRKSNTRTGGNTTEEKVIDEKTIPVPIQQPVGGEDNSYPKGKRLRASEFEASKQHTHRVMR